MIIREQIHVQAIEQLLMEGHVILEIVDKRGLSRFFTVFKWQSAYKASIESVEYNTVEGIEITDFMAKSAANFMNRTEFISMFTRAVDLGLVVHMEFTKDAEWYKYQAK